MRFQGMKIMDKVNESPNLDQVISKLVRERSSKRNFLPDAVGHGASLLSDPGPQALGGG